ncbi:MAG: ankyrin repeat domain-containing protein [Rickettsiaceae bacterium]|nr:ankyrin repeat domain-containing protein [Rickettsiaceae bacterium]
MDNINQQDNSEITGTLPLENQVVNLTLNQEPLHQQDEDEEVNEPQENTDLVDEDLEQETAQQAQERPDVEQLLPPFHLAAWRGDLDGLRLLVREGYDLETTTFDNCTALHIASARGHIEITRFLLLEHGADIEAKAIHNSTPLSYACAKGHLGVVRFLVGLGADITAKSDYQSVIVDAILGGDLEIVRFLVERGADIEAKCHLGTTPLNHAAYEGNFEIVRFLVDQRANIEARDRYGWTPLHSASGQNHIEIAQFLIEKRANIEARDRYDETPLTLALWGGHTQIANFLVASGADIEAQVRGIPIFESACRNYRLDIAEFLINVGVDLNIDCWGHSRIYNLLTKCQQAELEAFINRDLYELATEANLTFHARVTLAMVQNGGYINFERLAGEINANGFGFGLIKGALAKLEEFSKQNIGISPLK